MKGLNNSSARVRDCSRMPLIMEITKDLSRGSLTSTAAMLDVAMLAQLQYWKKARNRCGFHWAR